MKVLISTHSFAASRKNKSAVEANPCVAATKFCSYNSGIVAGTCSYKKKQDRFLGLRSLTISTSKARLIVRSLALFNAQLFPESTGCVCVCGGGGGGVEGG